jgi:hypothetical protein
MVLWFVVSLIKLGFVPLLQLIVLWFVVYLIKPGFLPLQIMVLWFVTSLAALCHGLLFLL